MEFSSKRLKVLSGLIKEDIDYDPSFEPESEPFIDPDKNIVLAYALALGKKYGHISTGQLQHLLNKKEKLGINKGRIFAILSDSDKFSRFEDDSYKSMGIPVFTLNKGSIVEKIDAPVENKDPHKLILAYAMALGKKYGHVSIGQLQHLINKKDGFKPGLNVIFTTLHKSGKFDRVQDSLSVKTGIPIFAIKGGPSVKKESSVISEDWDNYKTLEEIEIKYLQKLMLAMGISTSDDRLPQIQEIFKTALNDAQTLGQINSDGLGDTNKPITGV